MKKDRGLVLTAPFLMLLTFFAPASGQPHVNSSPITRVEHFFAVSSDPESLLDFLAGELMLPEAWPYKDYGAFASGAVSLGDVVFEVVRLPDSAFEKARLSGIAFEPEGDTESLVAWLETRGVAYADPQPFPRDREDPLWENTFLPELSEGRWMIFVCDYKHRDDVAAGRAEAAAELTANRGGPLRIRGAESLILTTMDLARSSAAWSRLLPTREAKGSLTVDFDGGPSIRIQSGRGPDSMTLVLWTESLEAAAAFLEDRGWLGDRDADSVSLSSHVVQGLEIVLVQAERGAP